MNENSDEVAMKSWEEREHMLTEAVKRIRKECSAVPQVGLILGSGFSPLVESVGRGCAISYSTIPHFKETTVLGHQGFLVIGSFGGTTAAFLQGRVHLYEGHTTEDVTFPVCVLAKLGAHSLIVTNASGSLTKEIGPGEPMVVLDQIDLTFRPPLKGHCGWKDEPLTRRPWSLYDKRFIDLAMRVAAETGVSLRQGVLCTSLGPSYETAAESRFMARIGAHAACMSTSHEVAIANALGLRVLGISCISNLATGVGAEEVSHEEVDRVVGRTARRLTPFFEEVVGRMAAEARAD
ncbi:MAG: purine-nucleoside phosphorylase [Candidatus Eisenbacteria bacterium]